MTRFLLAVDPKAYVFFSGIVVSLGISVAIEALLSVKGESGVRIAVVGALTTLAGGLLYAIGDIASQLHLIVASAPLHGRWRKELQAQLCAARASDVRKLGIPLALFLMLAGGLAYGEAF